MTVYDLFFHSLLDFIIPNKSACPSYFNILIFFLVLFGEYLFKNLFAIVYGFLSKALSESINNKNGSNIEQLNRQGKDGYSEKCIQTSNGIKTRIFLKINKHFHQN